MVTTFKRQSVSHVKNCKYFIYAILFILMLLLHSVMGICSDDLYNIHELDNQSWLSYVKNLYFTTNSRVFINGTIVVLVRYNLWIWRILDSLAFVLIAYMIQTLFSKEKSLKTHVLCCGLVLLFPFIHLDSAGWVATSLTYIWTLAFGMLAVLPFSTYPDRFKKSYYLLLIPLCFSANMEQMCCVLFAFCILILFYGHFAKIISSYKYALLFLLITLFFLAFSFSCPGNAERFLIETAVRFPTFPDLSVFQKISLGIACTFHKLFAFDTLFYVFCLVLTIVSAVKRKGFFTVLPLIIVSPAYSLYMAFSGQSLFSLIKGSHTIPSPGSVTFAILILMAIVSILLLAWNLWMLSERKYLALSLFFAGLCSRLMLSFSPTLFVSGFRTTSLFYFCLIFIIYLQYEDVIAKYYSTFLKRSFGSVIVMGVLVNISLFLYIFWYIPIIRV